MAIFDKFSRGNFNLNQSVIEKISGFQIVFILTLLIPSLVWILNDASVWPWDQAWYGEVSVDLWFLSNHEPLRWVDLMLKAFSTKAPGIAWLGQLFIPLKELTGSIESALLISVLTAQFLTLFTTYKINQALGVGKNVNNILLIASTPLFIAMGHQYFVESLQIFFVSFFLWTTIKLQDKKNTIGIIYLILAITIGLAAKITSPIYVLFLGIISVYALFKNPNSKEIYLNKKFFYLISIITIFLALLTLAWYFINFKMIMNFAKDAASSSTLALHYGAKDNFVPKFIYWLTALQQSTFIPKILVAIISLLFFNFALKKFFFRKECKTSIQSKYNIVIYASAINIAFVLILFAMNINQENRYLLPLIPLVGIIYVYIESYCTEVIKKIIFLLLAIQFILINLQAFGLIKEISEVSYWVRPIETDYNKKDEVTKIVELTSTNYANSKLNMVGIELPWLNANTLSFYASKDRLKTNLKASYTSLGYAETDIKKAISRINELKPIYFITLRQEELENVSDFLNITNNDAANYIMSSGRYTKNLNKNKLNIEIYELNEKTK
jgi:hypothetical protein